MPGLVQKSAQSHSHYFFPFHNIIAKLSGGKEATVFKREYTDFEATSHNGYC